jgi:hypothetical protein
VPRHAPRLISDIDYFVIRKSLFCTGFTGDESDLPEEVSGHGPGYAACERGEPLSATLESYSSTLLAVTKNGVRACPALGSDLQHALEGLQRRLACEVSLSLVRGTGRQVEERLQQWGGRTAEYFKAKTNDVKELPTPEMTWIPVAP